MYFILEVQKFNYGWNNDYLEVLPKSEKIGYINKVFETRQQASDYYNKFNPHMRPLNKYKTWRSKCDPKTRLMYVIKERSNEFLTLPAFD